MKQSKNNIGILGYGKVGKAISKLFYKSYITLIKDLEFDDIRKNKLDFLHICIPYTNRFIEIVINQIKINKPSLVIIHSTVKPGTTRSIYKVTQTNIVHSPIMGVHPKLFYYLFKFPKFIGPINNKSAKLASEHFKLTGLKTVIFNKPEETELAKLLDTTYYGLNIVFCKWVKQICDENNLDFENVYIKLNKAYNEGYASVLPNVRRPILKPISGRIGGSCIIPNAQILDKFKPNKISKLIKEAK